MDVILTDYIDPRTLLTKVEIWIDYGKVHFRAGKCIMTPKEWDTFRYAILEGSRMYQDGELKIEGRVRNAHHHAFLEGTNG